MDSFWIAARVIVPMALTVGIGVLLRVFHITDKPTMKQVDNLIFKIFMPALSFYNIYNTDFTQLRNVGYIFYGAGGILLLFLLSMTVVPKAWCPCLVRWQFLCSMPWRQSCWKLGGMALLRRRSCCWPLPRTLR